MTQYRWEIEWAASLKKQQGLFIQLYFFQQDRQYHLFKYLEWMAHSHELRLGSLFTPDRGFPLNLCYMKQERVCRVHTDHHWNVSSTGAQQFTLKHLQGIAPTGAPGLLQRKTNNFILPLPHVPSLSIWGAQEEGLKAQQWIMFFFEVLVPQRRKK